MDTCIIHIVYPEIAGRILRKRFVSRDARPTRREDVGFSAHRVIKTFANDVFADDLAFLVLLAGKAERRETTSIRRVPIVGACNLL